MDKLQIENLGVNYGDMVALHNVSLAVEAQHMTALIGPSGCGKTTLLRTIAGLTRVTSGQIRIDGRDVTRLPPEKRNTGMVFQNYALFPHMSVAENIHFGLKMRHLGLPEIQARTREVLELVHLSEFEDRLPRQLSGGQQQRVAVARTLATRPDVFLMDEPLSNLDAKLRQTVAIELRNLQKQLGLTAIVVTHDQSEAMMMADRIIVMREGRIVQQGSPSELYRQPASRFVAEFIGRTNVFTGQREATGFRTSKGLQIACTLNDAPAPAREVLSIRPESILLGEGARVLDNHFPAQVSALTYLGPRTIASLTLSTGETLQVDLNSETLYHQAPLETGAQIEIGWTQDAGQIIRDD